MSVAVLATLVLWMMGLDRASESGGIATAGRDSSAEVPSHTTPSDAMNQKLFASIQPEMKLWELVDTLGTPHIRQDVPGRDVGQIVRLYQGTGVVLHSGSLEQADEPSNASNDTFVEVVWQTDKLVMGPYGRTYQHIAVLLREDRVIAKRGAGLE